MPNKQNKNKRKIEIVESDCQGNKEKLADKKITKKNEIQNKLRMQKLKLAYNEDKQRLNISIDSNQFDNRQSKNMLKSKFVLENRFGV